MNTTRLGDFTPFKAREMCNFGLSLIRCTTFVNFIRIVFYKNLDKSRKLRKSAITVVSQDRFSEILSLGPRRILKIYARFNFLILDTQYYYIFKIASGRLFSKFIHLHIYLFSDIINEQNTM